MLIDIVSLNSEQWLRYGERGNEGTRLKHGRLMFDAVIYLENRRGIRIDPTDKSVNHNEEIINHILIIILKTSKFY